MNVRRCICCRARPGFRDSASLQSRYGCRVFVPLATLMIFAMCLITYSIFQIYGIFHAKASINNLPILQNDDLYELSIKSTIQKNWKKVNDDGTPKEDEVVLWGRVLVLMVVILSIIWPFVKLIWVTFLWFLPVRADWREKQMFFILMVGRWNLLQLFILNFFAICSWFDDVNETITVIPLILTLRVDVILDMTLESGTTTFVFGQMMVIFVSELIYHCTLTLSNPDEIAPMRPPSGRYSGKYSYVEGTVQNPHPLPLALVSQYSNFHEWLFNIIIAFTLIFIVIFLPIGFFFTKGAKITLEGFFATLTGFDGAYGETIYTTYEAVRKSHLAYENSAAKYFTDLHLALAVFFPLITSFIFLILWLIPLSRGVRGFLGNLCRILVAFCCLDVAAVAQIIVVGELNVLFMLLREQVLSVVNNVCLQVQQNQGQDCIHLQGYNLTGPWILLACSIAFLLCSVAVLRHPTVYRDNIGALQKTWLHRMSIRVHAESGYLPSSYAPVSDGEGLNVGSHAMRRRSVNGD